MIRKAIVLGAIVAPWLALTPIATTSLATVILYAITIVASFHGWGILVQRRTDADLMLSLQTGVAVVIVLAGVAIAGHCYGRNAQAALMFGGAAIHSTALASRFRVATERLPSPGAWLVPAIALAVLAFIYIVGAAGDLDTRTFDDDGSVFGQLRRLGDTGALADPIGYARELQLGGNLGLGALANVVGDAHAIRMLDGIGFALVVAFAISRLRSHPAGPLLATLLCVTAVASAFASADPVFVWIPIGLVVALFEVESVISVVVIAAALVALRLVFAPIAIVGVVAASRRDPRRALLLALFAFVAVAPYLVARIDAWSGVPAAVHAIALPARAKWLAGLGGFLLITALAAPLVLLVANGLRWHAFATVVGIAGITSHLLGTRYDARYIWPIAAAFVLALTIRLGRTAAASATALIVALLACLLIHEGQDTPGRLGWYRRTYDLISNIEYLRHVELGPATGYDLVDTVPRDETVAIWVTRPEQLDYSAHRIIDLRTPHLAPLREHRLVDKPSQLAALLQLLRVRYLLVEEDDAALQRRWSNVFEYFACGPPAPLGCADSLELLVRRHRVIASRDGVELVDLIPDR